MSKSILDAITHFCIVIMACPFAYMAFQADTTEQKLLYLILVFQITNFPNSVIRSKTDG